MSNINKKEDYTIALDSNGKVIFSEVSTIPEAYFFTTCAPNAETIIIGKKLSFNPSMLTNHKNIKKLYFYDINSYNSIKSYYDQDGRVNASGEKIEVMYAKNYISLPHRTLIFGDNTYLKEYETNTTFNVVDDGEDKSVEINTAIANVVSNGGKLTFAGDTTCVISNPIVIQTPPNSTVQKDFCIDFNHCRITVDGSVTAKNLLESMIHVNVDFANEEITGVIENIQLYPGICYDGRNYKPHAKTGLYLDSTSKIHYENIKILDVDRGVYIADKQGDDNNEYVTMDNIQISKKRNSAGESNLDKNCASEVGNAYENSTLVGVDCRASNCSFSNIIVIDYLIGMRVIGEKNNVYGAHVWNTYCPKQFEHSVCFINGGISGSTTENPENIYTACVADKFHIGWLSSDTADFKLTNCYWYNKEVEGVSYQEGAYGFFIPTNVANSYGENVDVGSNITAIDCYMVGSDLDNDTCFTNFCNINNNGINFSGPITNVFHGPLKNLNNVSLPEVQYGKIKAKEGVIENSDNERFNVYRLTPDKMNQPTNLTFTGSVYMDKINSATSGIGTISNSFPTTTQIAIDNNDVEFIINANDTYTSSNYINMNLERLGYETNDVGVICFDYYTEAVGAEYRTKELLLNSLRIKDYFTEAGIGSIPLEESSGKEYKTLAYMFKIAESTIKSMNISIGFGNRTGNKFNSNTTGTDFRKAISIKNLRIIKIPSDWSFPKYYLETEENAMRRLFNTLSRGEYSIGEYVDGDKTYDKVIFPAYSPSHPAYQKYSNSLSYVSLPFEHKVYGYTVEDTQYIPPYTLSYTALGRPCFTGNIVKRNDVPEDKTLTRPYLLLEYDIDPSNIFITASAKYPSYAEFAKEEDVGQVEGEHFKGEDVIIGADNLKNDDYLAAFYYSNLRNFEIKEETSICNSIMLPVYEVGNPYLKNLYDTTVEEPYIITNLISNLNGYHFESPVDADYSGNAPKYVDIPVYKYRYKKADKYGEIRLIMKNAEYNTELPTVFYGIEYPNTID